MVDFDVLRFRITEITSAVHISVNVNVDLSEGLKEYDYPSRSPLAGESFSISEASLVPILTNWSSPGITRAVAQCIARSFICAFHLVVSPPMFYCALN